VGQVIPLLSRPVELPWSCDQSGDCCRAVSEVTMTKEEAETLQPHVDPVVWASLKWRPVSADGRGVFIALQAAPCPFLRTVSETRAECGVHAVRPYNCRRFGCYRPDVAAEPFEPDHEEFGCANARERIRGSREVRRAAEQLQRKAQRWARNHGWQEA
jgi:Fe-S-cluster containining protein